MSLKMQPFRRAMMAKFPDQTVHFASCNKPRDIRSLSEMLVSRSLFLQPDLGVFLGAMELTEISDIAKRNPHATEMNVLVIGMPNVGKSTLLNSLRNMGIAGREFIRHRTLTLKRVERFAQGRLRHFKLRHSLAIRELSRPASSFQKILWSIHTTHPVSCYPFLEEAIEAQSEESNSL